MIKKLLTFILLQCVMSVAFAANYLTFTAEEAGSKFGILNSEDNDPDVQYSLDDGATWTVLKPGERVELKNVGDKALLKGNNPDGFSTAFEHDREYFYDYTQFIMRGKIAASGSVMSLVDGEGTSVKIPSNGCFYRLFSTCTALTKAPELPATTLRNQCYQEMFYDCTSLKKAPELPATKLFPGCYMFMFYFCENLIESPDLPATEFFKEYSGDASRFLPCYGGMFAKCRSLTKIKVNIPDWGELYEVTKGELDSNTDGWVTDVSFKGGIFVCPESLPKEYGENRIPRTWTVKSREEEFANYLTFTAVDGSAEFTIKNFGDNTPNIQYLMNGEWIDLEEGETVKMKGKNSTIMLRGTNPEGFSKSETQYTKFEMTGNIEASGSVMSLIDGFGETTVIPNGYCFTHLFENCESLIQAPELPSKRLTNNCYEYMFSGCTSLAGAPALPATTLAAECYEGMFINCKKIRVSPELPATTMADYCYYSMFAGCKGIIKAPELPATTLADHCYYKMFSGCTFTKAPELPATTLVDGCYSGMFSGCENVSQIKVNFTEWNETSTDEWVYGVAPIGYFICPKTLAEETGVDRIPKGWVLKNHINYLTFTAKEDSSTFGIEVHSENAPDIQYSLDGGETWTDLIAETAITLKSKGDQALLRGTNPEGFSKEYQYTKFVMTGKIAASGSVMSLIDGTGETTAIPNGYCFTHLFEFCTSLTQAPELPSKKLTNNCYEYMFSDCTSLVEAPALPAKTLAAECYEGMFIRCKKIRIAPELPAKTLADYCYYDMFGGCDGLIKAPELPATTLADHCYYNMFSGCTFTKAPELPATTLADGCYDGMFSACENVSLIKVNFTEWSEKSTSGWVYNVAPTGTFICPKSLAIETGIDRIPEGWVVKYIEDLTPNYLTFTAEEDASTFAIHYGGSVAGIRNYNPDIQYSLDEGETWIDLTEETTVTLNKKGDKALLRGSNPNGLSGLTGFDNQYTKFQMTGKIAASGSVMSLIDGFGKATVIPNSYCFCHLFDKCTSLTQAPELPATTLSEYCYYEMFKGCTSLTQAPALPATTLAASCYDGMFYDCKSLTQAPELPATTMTDRCYIAMFSGCESLTQAPALPATMLAYRCYFDMFAGCKSLTQAPELPATTMAKECYLGLFYCCTSLKQAPALPATTLAEACYWTMFYGCTNLTQAPELPATTLAEGCYRAMFEGCRSLTHAPSLPATTLPESCYREMFKNCSNLTKSPELPAPVLSNLLASDCYMDLFSGCQNLSEIKVYFTRWDWRSTTDWVKNVAQTGTFICPKELAIETGVDRIPVGWVVEYVEDVDICVDPSTYTTAYSGGVSYTENGVVEVLDNGYTAEVGTFTLANPLGNATVFGGKADCAFKASWESKVSEDYMVGVGYHDNTASKKYAELGDIYAVYNYTKSGSAGNYSYIGVHGWMKNPLIEYFIVDDTFDPNAVAMFYACNQRGKYTVDGVEYRLMVGQRVATPSIEGTANYQQIFAVRSSYQTCGAINVTEHFKNWENLEIEFGNIYDCKILCNVGGGTGSIEYTCASMSWDGKRSSLGDLSCSKVSYSDPTDVVDAVSSEIAVWTEENTIYVRGAESDVEVYDMLGRLIVSKRGGQENIQVSVPQKGIYVVKVGTETHKVVL